MALPISAAAGVAGPIGAGEAIGGTGKREGAVSDVGGIAGDRLKSFIERAERLEEEKRALAADLKEVFTEARGAGFDVKIMRKIIAERRRDKDAVDEEQTLLDVYRRALGMLADLPLGESAVAAARKKPKGTLRAEVRAKFEDAGFAGDGSAGNPFHLADEPGPKSSPESIEFERDPASELGRAAAAAGRAAATNPYPLDAPDNRAIWQEAWVAEWNIRRGGETSPDRSADIARALGRAVENPRSAENPFRDGTIEAEAWEDGWSGEVDADQDPMELAEA